YEFAKALNILSEKGHPDRSSNSWEAQFRAIMTLRRCARFHKELIRPKTKEVILCISSLANSLRSNLSKNAIVCIEELFVNLGKELDGEMEHIVPILLKK